MGLGIVQATHEIERTVLVDVHMVVRIKLPVVAGAPVEVNLGFAVIPARLFPDALPGISSQLLQFFNAYFSLHSHRAPSVLCSLF